MRISPRLIVRTAGILCSVVSVTSLFLSIYDLFSPWPVVSEALERYGRHYRGCVGISSSFYTISGGSTKSFKSNRQRAFLLMRAPISWPLLVTVTQDQDGKVIVAEDVRGF